GMDLVSVVQMCALPILIKFEASGGITLKNVRRVAANGNVIDSRGCHALHVFQRNAAACFELNVVPSQRDSFPNLRGCHVVEEDNVYAVHLDKSAGLFQIVSLHLNADVWPLLAKLTNSIGKTGKPSKGGQMIVFYEHHVVQAETMINATASDHCSLFQRA